MAVPSVASTDKSAEPLSRHMIAPTTALNDRLAPTDRSMPRVRITINCPSASTDTTADCLRTLPMFSSDKKTSEDTPITATSSARITNGPA